MSIAWVQVGINVLSDVVSQYMQFKDVVWRPDSLCLSKTTAVCLLAGTGPVSWWADVPADR